MIGRIRSGWRVHASLMYCIVLCLVDHTGTINGRQLGVYTYSFVSFRTIDLCAIINQLVQRCGWNDERRIFINGQ